MGLQEYLQSRVAVLIRPWLLHDLSPIVQLHLSGLQLQLPPLELDVAALNSSLMTSSMLLLHRARLEGATLSFSPFRTPALTLELRGLHLAMRPRSAEDHFWAAKLRRTAEQQKRDAISAVDPEGAAAHAAAEILSKGEASSGFWTTFLTGLAFRTVRIQLKGAIIKLISDSRDGRVHSCSFHLKNVDMEEGIPEQTNGIGGLLGAVFAGIWDSLRKTAGPLTIVCKVAGLGLQLGQRHFSSDGRSHHQFGKASGALDNNVSGSHLTSTNEDSVIGDASVGAGGRALNSEIVLLVAKIHRIRLDSIHFDVPETTVQVDPKQVEILFSLLHQLQGIVSLESEVVQEALREQNKSQQNSGRTSKDLWQSAFGRVISASRKKRLKQVLWAGVLRRKYAHLYESWLREVGWGLDRDQLDASRYKSYTSQNERLRERIIRDLSLMEQDLPMEAIALARRIARCRVSVSIHEMDVTTLQGHVTVWGRCLYLVRPIFCVFERAWRMLALFSYCICRILYIMKLKVSCSMAKFRRERGAAKIESLPMPKPFHGKQSDFIFRKVSHFRENDAICNDLSGSVRARRMGEVKGSKRDWAVSITADFWRGSISIAGSPDTGIGQILHASTILTEKIDSESFSTMFIPAIRISWEEFCLGYHSDVTAWRLELACGSMQGEALSVISARFPEQLPKMLGNGNKVVTEERDVVKFLVTSPAPWVALSNDENKPSGSRDYMATSMWEKQQMKLWADWTHNDELEEGLTSSFGMNNGNSRPFLLGSFESLQGDPRAGETTTGLVVVGLAMGQLECSLDYSLIAHMTSLAMQFFNTSSFGTVSRQFDPYSSVVNNNKRINCSPAGSLHSCMVYYAGVIKEVVSTMALNKRFQVSVAIESPKLQVSELVLESADNQTTVEMTKNSVFYSGTGSASLELSLCFHFGLLKVVVWPTRSKREAVLGAAGQETESQQGLRFHDAEENVWLEMPPILKLSKNLESDVHSEHEQVGNNFFVSIRDAVVLLESTLNKTGAVPLLGPLTVTAESSVCRNKFLSLFQTTDAVSAAVVLTVSAVAIHFYINEVMAIFEVFASHWKAFMATPIFSKTIGSYGTAFENVHGKLGDSVQVAHDELLSTGSGLIQPSHAYMFFALRFQFQIEGIQCFLSEQRGTTVVKDTVGGLMLPNRVLQNLNMKAICIFVRHFLLKFSWGDGCQLSISVELQQLKSCIVDCKKIISKGQETDSLSGFFENCKGVGMDFSVETSTKPEAGKAATGAVLCGLVIDNCTLYFEGLFLKPEEDGFNVFEGVNFSHQSGKELLSSKALYWANLLSSQWSMKGKQNMQTGISAHQMGTDDDKETRNCWLAAELKIGKTLLTDFAVERLVYKETSVAFNCQKSLQIHVEIFGDFDSIAVESKGGLVVIHTRALVLLMQTSDLYVQILSSIMHTYVFENREMSIQPSNMHGESMQVDPVLDLPATGRPLSFPQECAYNSHGEHQYLHSAPTKSQLCGQRCNARSFPWSKSDIFFKFGAFSLVLAQSDTASGVPAEGLLFQMDAITSLVVSAESRSASVDITHFLICSLRDRGLALASLRKGSSRLPKFGSAPSEYELPSPQQDLDLSQSCLRSVPILLNNSELESTVDKQLLSEKAIDALSENSVPKNSTYGKMNSDWMSNCILESLKIFCSVENTLSDRGSDMGEWKNSYMGTCSIAGFDIAVTTSEIQLLLGLLASLSELFDRNGDSTLKTSPNYEEIYSQSAAANQFEMPDGAVVALKDVREHAYLAVEEEEGCYRLSGVLHYSLVGDRALFKVKYQDPGCRDPKQSWFSLLSVYAKNVDGEPFRVHFRPGSCLADIASTNDKSWELWHAIPYKSSTEQEGDALDAYGNLFGNMVHLVNQKSKCGLALLNSAPVIVKKPGNPFKVKVLQLSDRATWICNSRTLSGACGIPHVELKVGTVVITLLHATAGDLHLLPLLQGRLEDAQAVMQLGAHKMRIMGGSKIIVEYFEAQANLWIPIVYPIEHTFFYRRRRSLNNQEGCHYKKMPMVIFSSFKKVDIVISEPSLDTCLFSIGALDLAGPYTLRHSPVLANCCQVENQTGVVLVCSFNNAHQSNVGRIAAWQKDSFLVRYMSSRRELNSTVLSSTVALHLENSSGLSSPVHVSLMQPAIVAVRTRLRAEDGGETFSGPIVVIETSEQNQDGVKVTVSPVVRIHNASGIPLELRCRRARHGQEEGAVVLLENGDVIDDSMGAFDAINLHGELRKALASFNLGNYLLSIRPASVPVLAFGLQGYPEKPEHYLFDWSEDVKGAKAVRALGIFEKLQYGFMKTLRRHRLGSSFGTVHCNVKTIETDVKNTYSGQLEFHFLVRITRRQVPLTRTMALEKNQETTHAFIAWQEQQELMILPTIRVFNFLLSTIYVSITAGQNNYNEKLKVFDSKHSIDQGGQLSMYVDLTKLSFTIEHQSLSLLSKPICIGDWGGSSKQSAPKAPAGGIKDLDMEIDFEDGVHCAWLKVVRGDDGVLQVIVYTRYALQNDNKMPFLCCVPKQATSRWRGRNQWNGGDTISSLSAESGLLLPCQSRISWLKRSSKILLQRQDTVSSVAELDIDSFPGSTELTLSIHHANGLIEQLQLGVNLKMPSATELDPTHMIHIVPRFMVINESRHAIAVSQDGFQEDEHAVVALNSGERAALYPQLFSGQRTNNVRYPFGNASHGRKDSESSSQFFVRFRLKENGWNWSGPVCAGALGSFFIRFKSSLKMVNDVRQNLEQFKFAAVQVEELTSSLTMHFSMQSGDVAPYRLENRLQSMTVLFHQKDLTESEVLEAGKTISYAWDDLCLPHKLIVWVAGTQLCREISLDKLRPWKSFRAVRHNTGFGLQLPFQSQLEILGHYSNSGNASEIENKDVGYEICADGPQRVIRICEASDSMEEGWWQSHFMFPVAKMDFKIPSLSITLAESGVQKNEVQNDHFIDNRIVDPPIVCIQISGLFPEFIVSEKHTLFQLRVQTLNVDEKWQGAPFAAMLRVHSQDRFNKGDTVLHMAAVISNHASNPNQVKYASILLQAVDLNVDEDTLMKLVPFYRYSLAESGSPSRQIYFDRFEIHPIKILASFLPGQVHADYTSTQETLRALLHSVIKIPSIRGTTVELNGILLSHALLTFRQLLIKCVQHYSWYAMRAIYLVKGSKLLPPAFASLFDDSAASSLDIFFDPSNGSIDLQGLTLGMFALLNKGLHKRGYGGTSRYIGDLEQAMKTAGSNILFAVLREVSDNMLKGAEAGGLDGMITGFRRGVLTVAMEPSVLRSAVVKGGSSRRIKLDRSAGVDEMYIEGYLQAMLDALFKQDYLRVKVVDDQVFLKNLPPNTVLLDEIIGCVKNFLIGEGLLAGETSAAAVRSLRRLQGETERRLGPAVIALSEQLFVIFSVRALRNQTRAWLHLDRSDRKGSDSPNESDGHMLQQTDGTSSAHHQANNGNNKGSIKRAVGNFIISSAVAYIDGRLCRHIPNVLARQIVSGFLLSFVE